MADGKWVMTEEDSRRVDLSFEGKADGMLRELPNHGKNIAVDDRGGRAASVCAFCGSSDLQAGFGGFGEGYGYRSCKCRNCGGTTDFVYKDENGKYF